MAQKTKTIVTLTDDIDGTKAERTVLFAVDGANYEIELSKKNTAAFEKALTPYLQAGRRQRTASAGPSKRARSRDDLTEIRTWAKANGHEVSERGRIPTAIQDGYDAAH